MFRLPVLAASITAACMVATPPASAAPIFTVELDALPSVIMQNDGVQVMVTFHVDASSPEPFSFLPLTVYSHWETISTEYRDIAIDRFRLQRHRNTLIQPGESMTVPTHGLMPRFGTVTPGVYVFGMTFMNYSDPIAFGTVQWDVVAGINPTPFRPTVPEPTGMAIVGILAGLVWRSARSRRDA